MVTIGIEIQDLECRVLLDRFIEYMLQILFNRRNDELPSILGAPDDMILKLVDTVIEASNSHDPSVARHEMACYERYPFIPARKRLHSQRTHRFRAGFSG